MDQSLSIILSSLNTQQRRLDITNKNIANINSPGYKRIDVGQETKVLDDQAAGTRVSSVKRAQNMALMSSLLESYGAVEHHAVAYKALDNGINLAFGNPSDPNSTIPKKMLNMISSIRDSIAMSGQNKYRKIVLGNIRNFFHDLKRTRDSLDQAQVNLFKRTQEQTRQLNKLIGELTGMQRQIATSPNDDITGLETRRDQLLEQVAKLIPIKWHHTKNYDKETLMFYSDTHTLRETENTFELSLVNRLKLNGMIYQPSSGSLKGLLDSQEAMKGASNKIDTLLKHMVKVLNNVHNSYTSIPTQNALKGGATLYTSHSDNDMKGNLVMRFMNADNSVASKHVINLSAAAAGATIGDLITHINTTVGAGTAVLLNGVLQLNAPAGKTLVLDVSDTTDTKGQNFGTAFKISNLLDQNGELLSQDINTYKIQNNKLVQSSAAFNSMLQKLEENNIQQNGSNISAYNSLIGTISDLSLQAQHHRSKEQSAKIQNTSLATALKQETGVRMEEEMRNVMLIQRSQQASSKMMQVLKKLFDTYMNMLNVL